MKRSADRLPTGGSAPLAPEFDVFDLTTSKGFWCDVLGFQNCRRGERQQAVPGAGSERIAAAARARFGGEMIAPNSRPSNSVACH